MKDAPTLAELVRLARAAERMHLRWIIKPNAANRAAAEAAETALREALEAVMHAWSERAQGSFW